MSNGYSEEQVMLTLAGLAYRGFQDVLPGEPHQQVVRRAVLDGLTGANALGPVRDDWDIVWGPVTSRIPLGVFDSSAMYVVRSKTVAHRYVVVVRGTNPVASTDWLLGDFLVGATVAWPYAQNAAAVSASTALGLMTLQRMRSVSGSPVSAFADAIETHLGGELDELSSAGRAWLGGLTQSASAHPVALLGQAERVVAHWLTSMQPRAEVLARVGTVPAAAQIASQDLRRPLQAITDPDAGIELLTFLSTAAAGSATPLEVVVTGHSKGGALAPALALWLTETQDRNRTPANECWDPGGAAQIRCVAFAGPTPGNRAFADRVDQRVGAGLSQVANANDLVTKAWRVADLGMIPSLYGIRSAPLAPLVGLVGNAVASFAYEHPTNGRSSFQGALDPARPLAAELIHQHMDAYLVDLGLDHLMSAFTFFVA
jgi:hypothetical protein